MTFSPPSPTEQRRALGSLEELPPELARAFKPAGHFEALPSPGPQDWLANHPEAGQGFDEWLAEDPLRPDGRRHTIYLQPLEDFGEARGPELDRLQAFAAAFFAMDVVLLSPLEDALPTITSRQEALPRKREQPSQREQTGRRQLLTTDILNLLRLCQPEDAYCTVGVTLHDLYPGPQWNFVFGQAAPQYRVGVYSLARYMPWFPGNGGEHDESLVLRRSCKVLAHETCHILGMQHCIYYRCLMNGSNHLQESDARPLHLCPVDLRKLHFSTGFAAATRYRRLRAFAAEAGFAEEARWLDERLAFLDEQ